MNFTPIKQLFIDDNLRRYRGISRLLPDFIIVGAQKAGTTSLFHYLKQHPQIIGSKPNEVHFFDYNFHKGLGYYRSYFPTKTELQLQQNDLRKTVITGETSPSYLFFSFVPQRIAKTLPNIKIIILLRDPVARSFSQYHHEVRKGRETESFEAAITREETGETSNRYQSGEYSSHQYGCKSYLARGRYIEGIKAYFSLFKPEQILILSSEDFFSKPQKVYDSILKFLNLEPFVITDVKAKNVGNYSKKAIPLEHKLRKYFQPYNQELYSFLERDFNW